MITDELALRLAQALLQEAGFDPVQFPKERQRSQSKGKK